MSTQALCTVHANLHHLTCISTLWISVRLFQWPHNHSNYRLTKPRGRGVRLASSNPDPIPDQNLQFFDTHFQNWSLEFILVFRLSDQNGYTPYPTSDQNSSETIPFGATHNYIAYVGEYTPEPLPKAITFQWLSEWLHVTISC